jgi:hypothetical protein
VDHGVAAAARQQRGEERVVGVGRRVGGGASGGAHECVDMEGLAEPAELAVEVENGAGEGARGGKRREEREDERTGAVEVGVEVRGGEALDGDEKWGGVGAEGGEAEGMVEEREEEAHD